ncbi:hypothetical protein EV138_4987 [Kribbella voronezhensis]|uniref:Uncharacterized protein n=1 Tax=Kribbella voronezhensis TaxID=2512212 RepID=A0A4R7TGI2_9ACTN|nr:hypothetical protein [Kribbella voronezhensis]TDU91381.1 hypothetical protein EV138_4987 [Kribbella voronezhensis]
MSDETSGDRARQLLLARFGSCGSRIPPHPDVDLLRLNASLPSQCRIGRQVVIPIEMSLKNLTDAVVRLSTYRSGARMAITKDGVVVAGAGGVRPVGTTYVVQPGGAHAYSSILNLVACETQKVLPPGDYQVHAIQPFTFVGVDLTVNVCGGPWDLQLR